MKLIIAGSRQLRDPAYVDEAVEASGWLQDVLEVVSGGASGVDRLGELWAQARGIKINVYVPDYSRYVGYLAPKLRNNVMADYGDRLVAVWDGISGGTAHMIAAMVARGKPVYVVRRGR